MKDAANLSDPFWQGLKDRRLMLQFDEVSGRAQFYPRPQSLYGEAGVAWRQASGRGVILALTLSHVGPPAMTALLPYPLALVRLDEGPRMLVRIDAAYASLSIGQGVRVAWHAGDEGAFPVFEPAT
jgi:uncharacterized OB-fold protein